MARDGLTRRSGPSSLCLVSHRLCVTADVTCSQSRGVNGLVQSCGPQCSDPPRACSPPDCQGNLITALREVELDGLSAQGGGGVWFRSRGLPGNKRSSVTRPISAISCVEPSLTNPFVKVWL